MTQLSTYGVNATMEELSLHVQMASSLKPMSEHCRNDLDGASMMCKRNDRVAEVNIIRGETQCALFGDSIQELFVRVRSVLQTQDSIHFTREVKRHRWTVDYTPL